MSEQTFEVRVRPQRRHFVTLTPFEPIPANADGSGGGIVLRVRGASADPTMVSVVWGERTEIELVLGEGDAA